MPAEYAPPIADIRFALEHLVDAAGLRELPGFEHADLDTMEGLLEEYGRFCAEVLAPLNRVGDEHGSTFDPDTGTVTTPPGWREAYAKYVEAGWGSVPFPVEHGGGGFPWLLAVAMQELITSANMAFSICPLLNQGAIDMLWHHSDVEQQETYLRRMVSGEWAGTMNLTEPQAGSDVGALTTRAVPSDDGSGTWRITGTKIFISYGEQDLTDNVVHLVLARVPDAPPGTKGISCFIVPKVLEGGERNAVRCTGIEHKMGIHASPTCSMEYDGAVGYLIGEANAGMRYMFTMMNNARLSVGLSGLALAERAYQAAAAYAHERVQRGPIVEHPDVRRMLVHIRAHVEAMRALVYTNAWAIDLATHGRDDDERRRGQELADLLTPITKSWCTDLGSELTRLATQVHGGMGYIAETGVEQFERDIRIAAIYEGTNGIQAIDLVGRKLPMRDGGAVLEQLAAMDATAAEVGGDLGEQLADAVSALREASEWLLAKGFGDVRDALAGATPYLRLFGTVLGGWFLVRAAATGDEERGVLARYYCEQVLPQARALVPAVTAGHDVLTAFEP